MSQGLEDLHLDQMLEQVGVIAGVVAVTITEHGSVLPQGENAILHPSRPKSAAVRGRKMACQARLLLVRIGPSLRV